MTLTPEQIAELQKLCADAKAAVKAHRVQVSFDISDAPITGREWSCGIRAAEYSPQDYAFGCCAVEAAAGAIAKFESSKLHRAATLRAELAALEGK